MKKIQYLAFLMLSLFTLTMTGCSDDDDGDNVSPQRSMLTAEEWKGQSVWADGTDWTPFLLLFANIDVSTWRAKFDNNGNVTMNVNLGDISEGPASNTGKWEFADNEQTIVFGAGTQDEVRGTILKLTDSELHLEFVDEELEDVFNDDKVQVRFTR